MARKAPGVFYIGEKMKIKQKEEIPYFNFITYVYDLNTLKRLCDKYGKFPYLPYINGTFKLPAYFTFRQSRFNGHQGISTNHLDIKALRKNALMYKNYIELTPEILLNPNDYPEYFI